MADEEEREDIEARGGEHLSGGEDWDSLLDHLMEYDAIGEELIRLILAGECPSCGGDTVLGEDSEGVEDPTVGCCTSCGHIWCLLCGTELEPCGQCGHWDVCAECDEEKDEYEDCGIPVDECPHIIQWLEHCATVRGDQCAWCREDIPEETELFAVGAKLRDGIELVNRHEADSAAIILVVIGGREIPALVTALGSEARREGNDILFVTCSIKCAEGLKTALEDEKEFIERISLN